MSKQSIQDKGLTVKTTQAPEGAMGQKLLVSGDTLALRLWDEQPGDGTSKSLAARSYEVAGYVLSGRAELTIKNKHTEDKTIVLEPGMSWVVPQHSEHTYKILEPFRAVEATHPPARGYDSGL